MEKSTEFEQKKLINIELTQGKELASQLKDHLGSRREAEQINCEFLVEKIISSYEKALSMLKSRALIMELPATATLNSPPSISSGDSPTSDISNQSNKNVLKKRKALPQWSEQVQVSLETGVEGPPSDGYSWRKYGQKDILGANFPRAYYRCTHRNTRGCFATKQVQKSEENPSLLQVTYRGRHTCQCDHQATMASQGKRQKKGKHQTENENKIPEKTQGNTINFGQGLDGEEMLRLPSFSFPSTLIESENFENYIFSMDLGDNDFIDSYSQPFITQETSESNYFSLSPTSHLNNLGVFHNLQSSESDVTEILSYPNSVTNSPIGDLDVALEKVDFDPNFPLDILEFFP